MSKNSPTFWSNANSKKSLGQPGKEVWECCPSDDTQLSPRDQVFVSLVFFNLDSDALGRNEGWVNSTLCSLGRL